jgi:hypothetical protein
MQQPGICTLFNSALTEALGDRGCCSLSPAGCGKGVIAGSFLESITQRLKPTLLIGFIGTIEACPDAKNEKQILRPAYPTDFVRGAPSLQGSG